jgi:hypothetical protein
MADNELNDIPALSETYTGGDLAGGEELAPSREGLEQGGRELTENRERETTSGERGIITVDYRGDDGEAHPDRSEISIRKAASDLGGYRTSRVREAEERAIESVRSGTPLAEPAARQQQAAPQYAPQPVPQPQYALGTRSEWLAPETFQRIQALYKADTETLAETEVLIGEAASRGESLDALYQHRNTCIAQLGHLEYLGRIVQMLHSSPDCPPELAIALAAPSVMQAHQQIIAGYEQRYSATTAAALRMAENAHTSAQAAMYTYFSELRQTAGPDYKNLRQVLEGIRSQNSNRAKWIDYYLALQEQTYIEMRNLQKLQAQRHEQQRQAYRALHDQLLDTRRPELKSPEVKRQIAMDVIEYMKSRGATMAEIKAAHHTPEFHNVVVAEAFMDAAKYHKASKNVSQRRSNKAPNVLRPGSTTETPGRSAPKMPEFDGNEASQLRAGADALLARRARR